MSKITDFLHPLWQKAYKNDKNGKYEVNNAILKAIDTEMDTVESQTIAAKSQLFMSTASEEWLDYWGSWFGLKRKVGQDDDSYRSAIIEHIEHPRDTIPALRSAIAKFLGSDVSCVNIYEPWTDIFILNDSKLNSKAHLMGDYYQYGVIDVQVNKPFNTGIIDILNWFRPGGVIWVLTYDPGDSVDSEIWHMSPEYADLCARMTEYDELIGIDKHLNATLALNSVSNSYGISPFILNYSKLNGTDEINGDDYQNIKYYNSLGSLSGEITPAINEDIQGFNNQVETVDTSNYDSLSSEDGTGYEFTVSEDSKNHNYLNDTEELDKWSISNGNYLSDTSYLGRSVMEFVSSDITTYAPNLVHLVQGNSYVFSLFARADDFAGSPKIDLIISNSGGNVADYQVASNVKDTFGKFSYNFNFTGSTGDYFVGIKVSYTVSQNNYVYINSFMLRDAVLPLTGFNTVIPDWMPSSQDYPADYTKNGYYIYATFNLYRFYYENVEAKSDVLSKLGSNADNSSISKYISDSLTVKNLAVSYKTNDLLQESVLVNTMIYNFKLGLWEKMSAKVLQQEIVSDVISINSFENYVNNEGLVFTCINPTALNKDYNFLLDTVNFYLDSITSGAFGINLYSKTDTVTNETMIDTDSDIPANTDTQLLYGKQEDGYPIKKVRITYQKIANPTSNSNEVIDTSELVSSKYVTGNISNSINSGISVIGLNFNDAVHNNLLGNLSTFDDKNRVIKPTWKCLDGSASQIVSDSYMPLSGFAGSHFSINNSGKLLTTSSGLFRNENYNFHTNLIVDHDTTVTVNIYEVANNVKNLVGTEKFSVPSNSGSTSSKTNPYDILSETSYPISIKFNTGEFDPEYMAFDIIYSNGLSSLWVSDPKIYLDYSATIDSTSYNNELPDFEMNNGSFIANPLSVQDNNMHIIQIDLGDTFEISDFNIGFSKGLYRVKVEYAIADSSNYQIIYDNFANSSNFDIQTNYPIKFDLPVFNSIENSLDSGLSTSELTGYPDSNISHGASVVPIYSLMNNLFNHGDLSIGWANNEYYGIYSYLGYGNSPVSPDSSSMVPNLTASDNESLANIESLSETVGGVSGFLVDHDRLNVQLPDPVEFYKEVGLKSSSGSGSSSTSSSGSFIDLRVVKFNLYSRFRAAMPDFIENNDINTVLDRVSYFKKIISINQSSFSLTVNVASTVGSVYVAGYNYSTNNWDNISYNTTSGTATINLTLNNPVNYISDSGLISLGVYSLSQGSLTDLVNISGFNLPIIISADKINNSYLMPKRLPIYTLPNIIKKLSINSSLLKLVDLPSSFPSDFHQGIMAINLVNNIAQGSLILTASDGSANFSISKELNFGSQSFQFSIDFDVINSMNNPSVALYVNNTNDAIDISSIIIYGGASE